jgi:hypothetical protein
VETSFSSLSVQLPRSPMIAGLLESRRVRAGMTHWLDQHLGVLDRHLVEQLVPFAVSFSITRIWSV